MKVSQEIIYGIVLTRAFFQWYREEQETTDEKTETTIIPKLSD
jgi:hypothetical protein